MLNVNSVNPFDLPSMPLSDRVKLPRTPCIYFAIDSQNNIQYIGRSINPRSRWTSHHRYKQLNGMGNVKIAYLMVDDSSLLSQIEKALIKWFDPPLNADYQSADTNNGSVLRIKELRERKGLSQDDLARLVDKTTTTVRNWEHGRTSTEWIKSVISLCNALGCKPEDLITEEDI